MLISKTMERVDKMSRKKKKDKKQPGIDKLNINSVVKTTMKIMLTMSTF